MWHVDDSELHAYLDGELEVVAGARSTDIEAHLAVCEACGTRLEQARRYRSAARSLLHAADPRPGDSPSFEEVLRRAHGDVETARRLWWRSPRVLTWAASVTIAVGAGWFARAAMNPGAADVAGTSTAQAHAESAAPGVHAEDVAARALDEPASSHAAAAPMTDRATQVGRAASDPGTGTGRSAQVAASAAGASGDAVAPPPAAAVLPGTDAVPGGESLLAVFTTGVAEMGRSAPADTAHRAWDTSSVELVEPRLEVARSIHTPEAAADIAPVPDAVAPLSSETVRAYADGQATRLQRPAAAVQPGTTEASSAATARGSTGSAGPFDAKARKDAEKSESSEANRFLGRVITAVADAIVGGGESRTSSTPEPPVPSPPPVVRGVVLEEGNRAALVGTRVLLIARDGKAVRTAVADLEGTFVFEAVEPGTYHVAADRSGYELRPRRIVVEARGDVVVELQMRPIPPMEKPGSDPPPGAPIP